jgi:hypothetical protein
MIMESSFLGLSGTGLGESLKKKKKKKERRKDELKLAI